MAKANTSLVPEIQACRYKTGKTLGAGSYNVVRECVRIDTGMYYAAKVINKRLMVGREHFVHNEIAILKQISRGHENILSLVDYFETYNNVYIVMDLARGGEWLDRILRRSSYFESDAVNIIRSLASGIAYLHGLGIVHRDLKPENLLFDSEGQDSRVLIADFGLSRITDEEQFHVLRTTCGSPGYMAPEIYKKTGHGKPVDIWAIGVLAYYFLCGYGPFERDSSFEVMQAILSSVFTFTPDENWVDVSNSARDFISACLQVDPLKRLTATECLSHEFLTKTRADAPQEAPPDLLPRIKEHLNQRRSLHAATDTIRAISRLRESQAGDVAILTRSGVTENE